MSIVIAIVAFAAGFFTCLLIIAAFAVMVGTSLARESRTGSRAVDEELRQMTGDSR